MSLDFNRNSKVTISRNVIDDNYLNKLLELQALAYERLLTTVKNTKQALLFFPNLDYVETYLVNLDTQWQRFSIRHKAIIEYVTYSSVFYQNHDYLKHDTFHRAKHIYENQKNTLLFTAKHFERKRKLQ